MANYPQSPVAQPVPVGQPPVGQPAPTPQANPYQGAWNLFNQSVLTPQNAIADQQLGYLGYQGGLVGANFDLQSQYLNQSLAQQLQGIGLSREQLGIQGGALGRQMGPGGLSQQYENLTQQLFGISEQDIQQQRQQAQFTNQQENRSAWSGSTARGATNTTGFHQQLTDIGQELQFRLGGINREEERLGVAKQQEGLRFGEEQASLRDASQMLGIQSKRLNLSEEELRTKINNGLAQLGIDRALSEVDILKAMSDVQNGKYTALGSVLSQVLAAGGVDTSGLGGSGGGGATGGTSYKGEAGLNSALQAANMAPVSDAEAWIINHESGFNTGSRNSSSGAFGLGQLNPSSGTLQSYASRFGYDPHTTDAGQQMNMFRAYVKDRYGTAENAQRFWQAHGWY